VLPEFPGLSRQARVSMTLDYAKIRLDAVVRNACFQQVCTLSVADVRPRRLIGRPS